MLQLANGWQSRNHHSLHINPLFVRKVHSCLETMIKPICENDDLDIDLVCEFTGKNPKWAQYHLKQKVGERLKDNDKYKCMLDDEGRRCWTLKYSQSANYHMDILPSLVCNGYGTVLEKAFSATVLDKNYETLAIRILIISNITIILKRLLKIG